MKNFFKIQILITFFFLILLQPVLGQEKRALVIGNYQYLMKELQNPKNDAFDMAKALKELGFVVELHFNLSQKEMEKAIEDFGKKLQPKSVGLFYFAGNGIQSKGKNYLLPLKAKITQENQIEKKAIDLEFVLEKMEKRTEGLKIIILDAAKENPLEKSLNRPQCQGLTLTTPFKNSMIFYATSPEKTSEEVAGRNGTYTKHLLIGLKVPNLPIETLFKFVSKNVEKETKGKQIPWQASSFTEGFQFNSPSNNEISSGLTLQLTGAKRINRGSRFRYRIEIKNHENSTNTGVILTYQLPEGIEFLEASNNGIFDKINQTVQWNLKELSAGKSYQVYITVKATQESPKTGWRNLATVKSNEFSEIKKNFITFVVSIPALHIEMDDLDDPIKIGNSTTYTIVCTNEGQKEATQLHFTFDIPAKGQYISHKASIGGTEIKGTFDSSKNKVIFEALKSLRAGDKAIYEITIKAVSEGEAIGTGTFRFAEFGRPFKLQEPTIFYK